MSSSIKKHLVWLTISLLVSAGSDNARGDAHEIINTGKWTVNELDARIAQASKLKDTSERIDFISRQFLGVPYQEKTLVGDAQTPELLVINLAGVDCFTFLDYVEAMRRSGSFAAFKENLRKVRYQNGVVDYKHRNHFFSDWTLFNAGFIDDVTGQIGAGKAKKTVKTLNAAEGSQTLLPGITVRRREITYIPSEFIDDLILAQLKTGDYLGVYIAQANLDASHVGIVIRKEGRIFFRHASSQEKYHTVVDEDLKNYLLHKPGVIILRPIGNDKSKLSLRGVPIYWDDVAISESFNGIASPSLHSGLRLTCSQ